MKNNGTSNAEQHRLSEGKSGQKNWKQWGPYLSERQWGTVREDYSPHGNAWEYLPHDHARSRAYRWGEDGLAGISDDSQRLCLSLALWNGKDPILKERLFGLTNSEGNHSGDTILADHPDLGRFELLLFSSVSHMRHDFVQAH